jgi:hypothetical protein
MYLYIYKHLNYSLICDIMDIYAYEQLMEKLDDILANQEQIKDKLGIGDSSDVDDIDEVDDDF